MISSEPMMVFSHDLSYGGWRRAIILFAMMIFTFTQFTLFNYITKRIILTRF